MGLYIEAIFNSIDGEANCYQGAGQLCTFIRLKGCNLKCEYCDTQYAQEPGVGEENKMEISAILEWPDMLKKITITGGEPLLQLGVKDLVGHLLLRDKFVSLETNGSIDLPSLVGYPSANESCCRYVVDYKMPSSGMEDWMRPDIFIGLRPYDVIKFVVMDFDDYYVARGLITGNRGWKASKVVSPAVTNQNDYTGWPATLAEMMIQDAKVLGNVQFSLQLHKVLWPNAKVER